MLYEVITELAHAVLAAAEELLRSGADDLPTTSTIKWR